MSQRFPRKSVVWRGAILGGIVNAIMTAQSPLYAFFQQWDGNHYGLKGGDGREGVVTFEGGPSSEERRLVGVFFSAHSDRSPFRCQGHYDLEKFFRGCPPYQRALAEEAGLPYLELPVNGKDIPCITAAFWDQEEHLAAADPWDEVLANGADLLHVELIEDAEAALAEWQNGYQMSPDQVAFARSLFQRKIARPAVAIELTHAEVEWLESMQIDPISKAIEGAQRRAGEQIGEPGVENQQTESDLQRTESPSPIRESPLAVQLCREKLAAIGILMPY